MKKLTPPTHIPERPVFQGHDVNASWPIPGYYRNLPHIRLANATYFVTFRLADSIPKSVAEEWQRARNQWLKARGIDPNEKNPKHLKEVYFKIPANERVAFERDMRHQFFLELDKCHGSCLLQHTCAHGLTANAMEFFHGQRVWCGDYVVMPNHVHVLVQPFPGIRLEDWLYSIKRFSSNQITKNGIHNANDMLRKRHLWQLESFDHIVRSSAELARIRKYIADNPKRMRAGTFVLKQMPWLDEFVP